MEGNSDPSVREKDRDPVARIVREVLPVGRLSAWTQGPFDWVFGLSSRLEHVADDVRREQIRTSLDDATDMVVQRRSWWAWRQRFLDWWNGTRIEAASTLLQDAAIRLVEHTDHVGLRMAVDDAVGFAETLPADDPMRVRFEQMLALETDATGAA